MFLAILRWLVFLVANMVMLALAYVLAPFLPMFAYKSRWHCFWSVFNMAMMYIYVGLFIFRLVNGYPVAQCLYAVLFVPLSLFAVWCLVPREKGGMNPHLPAWLSWFDQPDDDLDGDYGWKTKHRWFKNSPKVDTGWRRYLNRVRWLVRNPAYGFDIDVLGFTLAGDYFVDGINYSLESSFVNGYPSDRPLRPGRLLRTVTNSGRRYWFFYLVRKWSNKYCLSIKFGWKIWETAKAGDECQFVCSINPFASFEE